MADAEARLLELLVKIAKENDYDDKKIDVKPISSGGANYTSRLFSITLSSPGKDDLKLFSKAAILGEKARSMSEVQVYEIEILFYSTIIPKLIDLEDHNDIPDHEIMIFPEYYGGITDYSKELMVLEDITAKGFKATNRFKCFDWNYASRCVKVLANFQALSVALEKKEPTVYANFIDKLKFNSARDSLTDYINNCIITAIKLTDEIYRDRVEIFLKNEMKKETFFKFFNPERKVLLSHGDFRPSNILEKVDENGELQVVLVDYQMMKQGNPVTDLVYFLICGSDEDFRGKHLHQYFDHYYKTFSKSLERLGIDPDTVYREEDFRDDVKEMLPFGLTLATFALLFVLVDEDSAPKPEDGIDFGKFEIKASDQFQVRFNALVRDYVKFGIL